MPKKNSSIFQCFSRSHIIVRTTVDPTFIGQMYVLIFCAHFLCDFQKTCQFPKLQPTNVPLFSISDFPRCTIGNIYKFFFFSLLEIGNGCNFEFSTAIQGTNLSFCPGILASGQVLDLSHSQHPREISSICTAAGPHTGVAGVWTSCSETVRCQGTNAISAKLKVDVLRKKPRCKAVRVSGPRFIVCKNILKLLCRLKF